MQFSVIKINGTYRRIEVTAEPTSPPRNFLIILNVEFGPASNEQDKRLGVLVDITCDITDQELTEKIRKVNESVLHFLRERPDIESWIIGGQHADLAEGEVVNLDFTGRTPTFPS